MENLGKKQLRFIVFDSLLALDRADLKKLKHEKIIKIKIIKFILSVVKI